MLPVTTRHIGSYSGVKRIVCSTNQIQIPWCHCRHQHDNFQVPSISENKDGHTYRYWPLAGETTRGDWCVHHEGELWCANAFYLFDAQNVALYLLTDDKPAMRKCPARARQLRERSMVSRKRWRAFAACSLKGNSPSGGEESDAARKAYLRRFPVAVCCQRRYGKSGWMKLNSPTTRWGLVKTALVTRLTRPAGVAPRG